MTKNHSSIQPDIRFDVRELNCPVSLLLIRKIVKEMDLGKTLEVIGSNEGLRNDIATIFSRSKQGTLLENGLEGDFFKMVIQKKGGTHEQTK